MKQLLTCISLLFLFIAAVEESPGAEAMPPVKVITLQDTVNPATADYLVKAIEQAQDSALIIIALDTPGGLVDSMRRMVQAIMNSNVPVVVYVSPAGAHAASAGAFIMLAAHVSAMAPATNVGAAHPVSGSGGNVEGDMADKITNDLSAMVRSMAKERGRNADLAMSLVTESRSLDAQEAYELGLCDVVASDLGNLLAGLEGRKVVLHNGREVVISSKGGSIIFHNPGTRDRLLSLLANPSLAYILFMIGLAGLYFELTNPGAIFPGVLGGLSLILAFFAMSTLSISVTGLLLIGLAIIMFLLELKVPSSGLLSLAGVIALFLGSFMLFDGDLGLTVSWAVMLPTLILVSVFFMAVGILAGKAQLKFSPTGQNTLLGAQALVIGNNQVRVEGEIWQADTSGLGVGQSALVEKVDGLKLRLKKDQV